MTLTDVEAVRRQRRRTWITGGALLVLSSIAYVLGSGVLLFTSPLIMTLLAAGLIVLAIGLGHGGSVTAHRPTGTGAIIALAVMLVLKPLMFVVVMKVSYANEIDSDARNRANTLSTTITLVLLAVLLALAIVAAVQVARSGDVPRPWNWAPCWSLVAIVAIQGEALIHFPLSVAAEAVFTTPS